MKQKTAFALLAMILLVSLAFRLLIVTQSAYPSYESYRTLLQIRHIRETGLPIATDPAGGGQVAVVGPPLFYYAAAILSYVVPWDFLSRIGPSLISLGIVLVVYGLAFLVSRRQGPALCAAAAVAFLPVYFGSLFDFTPFAFSLLLLLSAGYAFLHMEYRAGIIGLLALLCALVLASPLSFFLIIVFLVYILLSRIEGQPPGKLELETIFLVTFLAFWANLIFYKKALLAHGIGVIWQNIPSRLLEMSFSNITFLGSFLALGVLTVVLGAFGVYFALFQLKSRSVLFMTSFTVLTFVVIWLRLLPLEEGLVFLGIGLAVLGSVSLARLFDYMAASRFSSLRPVVAIALAVVFVAVNVVASLAAGFSQLGSLPTSSEENALVWMSQHTSANATILSTIEESPFVAAESSRTAFIDSNFLLVPDVNRKFDDALILWEGGLSKEASDRFNAYGITYLYFSPSYQREFKKEVPSYISGIPDGCISLVYDQGVKVYSWQCLAPAGVSPAQNPLPRRPLS